MINSSPFDSVYGPLFAGREDLLSRAEQERVLLFLGRRRIGKSSLLMEIARRRSAADPSVVVLYVDMANAWVQRWQDGVGLEPTVIGGGSRSRIDGFCGVVDEVEGGEETPARRYLLLVDEPNGVSASGASKEQFLDFLRLLGRIASWASMGIGRWCGVFVADHVELLDSLLAANTGSYQVERFAVSKLAIGPLEKGELEQALAARGMRNKLEAVWWLSGGHPWLLALSHDATKKQGPVDALSREYMANGGDSDRALLATAAKKGLPWPPSETGIDMRRAIARLLFPHLLGISWPERVENETSVVTKSMAYNLSDDANLGHVGGATALLREIALGTLPRDEAMTGDRGAVLQLLADYGYIRLKGTPGEARQVEAVDLPSLFRWAAYEIPVDPPPASPLSLPLQRPGVGADLVVINFEERWIKLQVAGHPEILVKPLSVGAVLTAWMIAGEGATHCLAVESALPQMEHHFGRAVNELTKYLSEIRVAVKSAFAKHLSTVHTEAHVVEAHADLLSKQLLPLVSDRHVVLRTRDVQVESGAASPTMKLNGPGSEPRSVDAHTLAEHWKAFLRNEYVVVHARTTATIFDVQAEAGGKVAAVIVGGESFFAAPRVAPDAGWSPAKIRVVEGVVKDDNTAGSTLWSPPMLSRKACEGLWHAEETKRPRLKGHLVVVS